MIEVVVRNLHSDLPDRRWLNPHTIEQVRCHGDALYVKMRDGEVLILDTPDTYEATRVRAQQLVNDIREWVR